MSIKIKTHVDYFNDAVDEIILILVDMFGEKDQHIRKIKSLLSLRKFNKTIIIDSYIIQFHTETLKPLNDRLIFRDVEYFINTDLVNEFLSEKAIECTPDELKVDNHTYEFIKTLILKIQSALTHRTNTDLIFDVLEKMMINSLEYTNKQIKDITTNAVHQLSETN